MTAAEFAPRRRAERFIVSARLAFAIVALIATWLDPSSAAAGGGRALPFVAIYVAYVGAAAVVERLWYLRFLPLGTHIADVLAAAAFMYLARGLFTGPVFVYVVFLLVCATIRWQWRGTLSTAGAVLGTYVALRLAVPSMSTAPDGSVDRLVIQSLYVALTAVLLAYLGVSGLGLRSELVRLAQWPRRLPSDPDDLLREMLHHASQIVACRGSVFVWDGSDEPWRFVAYLRAGTFELTRVPSDRYEPLVHEKVGGVSFFCSAASAEQPTVVHASAPGGERLDGALLNPELLARYPAHTVLSILLWGEQWSGRLFFLDKRRLTLEDLVLAEIVGREVMLGIDQYYVLQQLREAGAVEERLQVGRDLHDGVLQSLAGMALQLEALRRELPEETGAQETIGELQRHLLDEQRHLRSFVEFLRSSEPATVAGRNLLGARLLEIGRRVEQVWGQQVELDVDPSVSAVSPGITRELAFLVNEALVNAARHAGASMVHVRVARRERSLEITVRDNGSGFPFQGDYTLEQLEASDTGPRSLRQRVRKLDGDIQVHSTTKGSTVEIQVPFA